MTYTVSTTSSPVNIRFLIFIGYFHPYKIYIFVHEMGPKIAAELGTTEQVMHIHIVLPWDEGLVDLQNLDIAQ